MTPHTAGIRTYTGAMSGTDCKYYTTEQLQQIADIANQCPYQGVISNTH
jgi:hypothetical protein